MTIHTEQCKGREKTYWRSAMPMTTHTDECKVRDNTYEGMQVPRQLIRKSARPVTTRTEENRASATEE